MKNSKTQKNALFAGIFYLILAITGFYSFVYVFPHIKVEGDIVKTVENISNNQFLFRIGIVSMLTMNIVSILLVIYLYRLLSKIHKTIALSMLILMLFGACISTLNEVNHFAMILINSLENWTLIEQQNLTQLFTEIQKHGSYIAVIFWGLWLFPLGALVFKLETPIAKFMGIMLAVAGVGYVLDSFFLFVYPDLKILVFTDYTSYGEILFMIWLLAKSGTIEKLAQSKSQLENSLS